MATQPPRDDDRVTLATLKDGAALEMFEAALSDVLENIEDPNFKAKGQRAIILKVSFAVDEDREMGAVSVEVDTKLQPRNPEDTIVHFGRRQGVLIAVEYDPRQRNMFDPERGDDVRPFRAVEAGGATKEEATPDD